MNRIAELIKQDEGFVEHAYQDHLGFLTIGFGRMVDARRGGRITPIEAEYLLNNDVNRIMGDLRLNFKWFETLSEARKAVLVSMIFQLGYNGFVKFKNTIELISKGQYADAALEMLQSKWAAQTPARAKRLSAMMANGEFLSETSSLAK